jgi:hypothetical protein
VTVESSRRQSEARTMQARAAFRNSDHTRHLEIRDVALLICRPPQRIPCRPRAHRDTAIEDECNRQRALV